MSTEEEFPLAGTDVAVARSELAIWFGHSNARGWWPLVAGVGVVGGLVSAGYVELLRVLTRAIGPDHFSKGVDIAVLAAVGLVIALLVKLLRPLFLLSLPLFLVAFCFPVVPSAGKSLGAWQTAPSSAGN